MAAGEGGDFVTIAAASHGAPAAAASSRQIGKEKAASRVGAEVEAGDGSLDENFRGRSRDGGEQPFGSAFPGKEFQPPLRIVPNKFVVPLGDAQNLVHGCNPFPGNFVLTHQRAENFAKRVAEAGHAREQLVGGLRIALGKGKKLGTSLRGDNTRIFEETDEARPIGFCGIGEIDGETAPDKK